MIQEGADSPLNIPSDIPFDIASGIYRCGQSYEQNYRNGPQSASGSEYIADTADPKFSFLGLRLRNPLGVSAGPVLNAEWVSHYFDLGFGVLVYKTVRSVFRASHPMPNCVAVLLQEERLEFDLAQLESVQSQGRLPEVLADSEEAARHTLHNLSITNSFGVPSMAPKVWMPDFERAASACGEGQLLIASVLGTEGARDLVRDFGYVAAMARDAGAKVIEANLSCPN